MAELLITTDGGVFVDLPRPYDPGLVEGARDALTLLFPDQEVRVLVDGAVPRLGLRRLPGKATSRGPAT